jgi:hypothetical protein
MYPPPLAGAERLADGAIALCVPACVPVSTSHAYLLTPLLLPLPLAAAVAGGAPQDLKCFVFSLISAHFKIQPIQK